MFGGFVSSGATTIRVGVVDPASVDGAPVGAAPGIDAGALHANADGPPATPEEGRPPGLAVPPARELGEDPRMDPEQGVPDPADPARHGVGPAVPVVRSPGLIARPGLVVVARSIGGPRVLDDPEEAVLGAEHVLDDRAHRPLVLRGRAVEIAVTHPREGAGQVAGCPVVLAEDALGLRDRWAVGGAQRREPDREVAELVLREEQGEAKALLVFAPDPRAAHGRIGEVDRGTHELLD